MWRPEYPYAGTDPAARNSRHSQVQVDEEEYEVEGDEHHGVPRMPLQLATVQDVGRIVDADVSRLHGP